MTPIGLPHSEISGSKRVNSSPKLIAACRVLHRLPMPRHSPLALSSLSIKPDKTNLIIKPSTRIEDKLSYCNPQGPVTLTVRRPHHKTRAHATPGGFRVTLLFDYQRPSRYLTSAFRHDVLRAELKLFFFNPPLKPSVLTTIWKRQQGRGPSLSVFCPLSSVF